MAIDQAPPAGTDWRLRGVRVVHADELDVNTPQTPGMNRAAAITPLGPAPRSCGRVPS